MSEKTKATIALLVLLKLVLVLIGFILLRSNIQISALLKNVLTT